MVPKAHERAQFKLKHDSKNRQTKTLVAVLPIPGIDAGAFRTIKVSVVQREMCQHRPPVRFRLGKEQRAAFGRLNAELLRLPRRERLRIARVGRITPPTPIALAMATLPAG
jgi:hypothetical protein